MMDDIHGSWKYLRTRPTTASMNLSFLDRSLFKSDRSARDMEWEDQLTTNYDSHVSFHSSRIDEHPHSSLLSNDINKFRR